MSNGSRSDDYIYRLLKWIAVVGAVGFISYLTYDHFRSFAPGDLKYVDGSNLFKDGHYNRAARYFSEALAEDPNHLFAIRGLADANTQLKRFPEALSGINQVIEMAPEDSCNLATRGVIYDHMGEHQRAMADYAFAIANCPEATEGMHWLTRLLHNIHERPPTVKERLDYLQQQMKLPESQRVLTIPEIDDAQRTYER